MNVGFVGLGLQGTGLARNTLAAGYDLSVFDLSAARKSEFADLGARIASSNEELARSCDLIQVCVLDDAQLIEVVCGSQGLLAGARPGTMIAVHSTVRPDTVIELAASAEKKGVEVIDAAVSGGAMGAAAKTMSFMVGGTPGAVEKCRPVFLCSGPSILHAGPVGCGLKAKLAHQVIIAINFMAAYEGMLLGTSAGIPAPLLEQIVREGVAQSKVATNWSTLYIGPQAPAVFYKDLKLCIELGRSLGLSLPATALCQQLIDIILADHLVPAEQKH